MQIRRIIKLVAPNKRLKNFRKKFEEPDPGAGRSFSTYGGKSGRMWAPASLFYWCHYQLFLSYAELSESEQVIALSSNELSVLSVTMACVLGVLV